VPCLTPAALVREPVTTIEGLASGDGALHPMQLSSIDHDVFPIRVDKLF
jgi:xanthine dehydrogenase YagT iron-sulfur-binding subunit